MKELLKKIFLSKKISSSKDLKFQELKDKSEVNKIFDAINSYNNISEVRYVGGCVRKILNKENTDDIDLATNLTPDQVKVCLDNSKIKYFETGLEHALIQFQNTLFCYYLNIPLLDQVLNLLQDQYHQYFLYSVFFLRIHRHT